jgi:hypothetical protein
MSFEASWLALRAPADDRARNAGLLREAIAWTAARAPCRVLDIGSGTGATRRVFGDRVPGARWWLTDNDPALLAMAEAVDATPMVLDLAADLESAFAVGPTLVTASAFFDLAGAAWIERFATQAASAGAAVYAALSYDGQQAWAPPHPEDAAVLPAFERDMARDKGLGPALGGDASRHLAACLEKHGYRIAAASTPWVLTRDRDQGLIGALAEGTAAATGASAAWLASRRDAQRVTVGHEDRWAVPPG